MRDKRPIGTPRGVVLFVHGATIGSVLFDLPVPGYSLLEVCAGAGWWTFAVDLRGYARSPKPFGMGLAAALCLPVCTAEEAHADIAATVEYVCHITGFDQVNLAGGSWGSVTAARYAASTPGRVNKLALLAPLYGTRNASWLNTLEDPDAPGFVNPKLGGYRLVREADLLSRWDLEIPRGQLRNRRDPKVLQAMLDEELRADPASGAANAFRVPNGTLYDLFGLFSGQPAYRAEAITMPCLLVRGADDQTSTHEDACLLYSSLGSLQKQHITVAESGHFLQAERNAPLVHEAILQFLGHTTKQKLTPTFVRDEF